MLNVPLFNALTKLLGESSGVVNENDPGSYTLPQRKGGKFGRKAKLYAHVDSWGEVYHFNCPKCNDQRGRLYVSYFSGESIKSKSPSGVFHFGYVYHCKNNNCRLDDFFRRLVVDKSDTVVNIKPSAHLRYEVMPSEFPENSIPIISSDVPTYVHEYLEERCFSPVCLDKNFTVRFVPKGSVYQQRNEEENKGERKFYEDRILIPIIQGYQVVSWQARAIGDASSKKYIFPLGCRKSTWLYNMDNAKFHSDLTIVEGVTDAWRVGPSAVALFGKSISNMQVEMLKYLWGFNGSCVVVLDPDAEEASKKLVERLRADKIFPKGVTYLQLAPGTDPAMYPTEQLRELIAEERLNCV